MVSGSVWYVPVCTVVSGGRSFHSWQATSHALQPMQVEVSTSLITVGSTRTPGAGAEVAETRSSSRTHTFSSFTRNPLYSGANEFGSTIVGVTRFASDPRCCPRPRKPQWIGKPIW